MSNVSHYNGNNSKQPPCELLFGAEVYGRHPISDFPVVESNPLVSCVGLVEIGRIDIAPIIITFCYRASLYSVLLSEALSAKELMAVISAAARKKLLALAHLNPKPAICYESTWHSIVS